MTSSPNRRARRAMAKAKTALSDIPGAVPEVPHDIEVLKNAIRDVHSMRDAITYLVSDVQRLIYENERGRAVSLRLMQMVSKGPRSFLVANQAAHFTIDELQDLELQFAAEYDAMCALVTLATRGE